jgi:hypothetical protein
MTLCAGFRYDYQYRVLANVLVRLMASGTVNINGLFSGYAGYLEVVVIGADFRHQQREFAVFRSASISPVGVTHSSADYTTMKRMAPA